MRTFGALPEVHFLHSIYHFKAQEVKNPMLQTVHDSELKRRSYSHCKQITPKCCEISLLLREFRSLFVQCYGIPPEATRYMPQAGTLRTSSQPNSEDFSTEDERLSFLSLGVRKAGRHPLVISCELEGKSKVKDHLEWQVLVVHAILNTIAEEAMNFMSYVAEVSRGWDEPNAKIWEE
ncbi:hypothetical protein CK203_094625 [Vitis vinifera]|uniref:Uncharacterized protein n=1 Tax=Vitis vinifera TaxID=29760 RepID=A0A438E366_VITVI|nr:hypothetical protein CK203_094625 [Vitis vinifera]